MLNIMNVPHVGIMQPSTLGNFMCPKQRLWLRSRPIETGTHGERSLTYAGHDGIDVTLRRGVPRQDGVDPGGMHVPPDALHRLILTKGRATARLKQPVNCRRAQAHGVRAVTQHPRVQ